MSKRYFFPQNYGDRKKAKLDISVSDHNFPLSQNLDFSKGPEKADNWGDDNDDEILLLASQACEEVYNGNDVSMLPDYSLCMQPGSTSTQLYEQTKPSSSKTEFTFKKPSSMSPNIVSTNLKKKCNMISSPLPGITNKITRDENQLVNGNDDLIFNEKILKGQDSDNVYRQLLQLQEENAKLKSENGKLLEKCVTKEGESSILRTQLKSCQLNVDNARMEKIKAQEKMQIEWTEKLTTVNNQLHDLRNQLDFKNLEIISIKEKCRMLESSKVKLTQVTVGGNESYRHNSSIHIGNDAMYNKKRDIKTTCNSVQTESQSAFVKLNKTLMIERSSLVEILPYILEQTTETQTLIENNEKLKKNSDFNENRCRIYSTFHRIPCTPVPNKGKIDKISLNDVHEDISYIATHRGDEAESRYFKVLQTLTTVLTNIQEQLEGITRRMTTAFQKAMDEKYIEYSTTFLVVEDTDLLCGRALFKDEQGILARRITAILSNISKTAKQVSTLKSYNNPISQGFDDQGSTVFKLLCRICSLLDSNFCAVLYSGLLLSITNLLGNILNQSRPTKTTQIVELLKTIITSRPMHFVLPQVLTLIRILALEEKLLGQLCPRNSVGNLKLDYDQGVLLYKKDSCTLQVLLKQVEASLKCIEKQNLVKEAAKVTRNLIGFYGNIDCENMNNEQEKNRCDCLSLLVQVIVYSLKICAHMHNRLKDDEESNKIDLLPLCRSGIRVVYGRVIRDSSLSSNVLFSEGQLILFCELIKEHIHSETYVNMLSEIAATFQSAVEDSPLPYNKQAWERSFDNFSIAD